MIITPCAFAIAIPSATTLAILIVLQRLVRALPAIVCDTWTASWADDLIVLTSAASRLINFGVVALAAITRATSVSEWITVWAVFALAIGRHYTPELPVMIGTFAPPPLSPWNKAQSHVC